MMGTVGAFRKAGLLLVVLSILMTGYSAVTAAQEPAAPAPAAEAPPAAPSGPATKPCT